MTIPIPIRKLKANWNFFRQYFIFKTPFKEVIGKVVRTDKKDRVQVQINNDVYILKTAPGVAENIQIGEPVTYDEKGYIIPYSVSSKLTRSEYYQVFSEIKKASKKSSESMKALSKSMKIAAKAGEKLAKAGEKLRKQIAPINTRKLKSSFSIDGKDGLIRIGNLEFKAKEINSEISINNEPINNQEKSITTFIAGTNIREDQLVSINDIQEMKEKNINLKSGIKIPERKFFKIIENEEIIMNIYRLEKEENGELLELIFKINQYLLNRTKEYILMMNKFEKLFENFKTKIIDEFYKHFVDNNLIGLYGILNYLVDHPLNKKDQFIYRKEINSNLIYMDNLSIQAQISDIEKKNLMKYYYPDIRESIIKEKDIDNKNPSIEKIDIRKLKRALDF